MHSLENNESKKSRKEDEAKSHVSIDRILLEALKLLVNYLGKIVVDPEVHQITLLCFFYLRRRPTWMHWLEFTLGWLRSGTCFV